MAGVINHSITDRYMIILIVISATVLQFINTKYNVKAILLTMYILFNLAIYLFVC